MRSLTYHRPRQWDSVIDLTGQAISAKLLAVTDNVEIWDHKDTRARNYTADYVRQLLTYAALFRDRAEALPVRCAPSSINEKKTQQRLVAIDVDDNVVQAPSTGRKIKPLTEVRGA